MAIKFKDRVAQTSTVEGTAAVTFSASILGYQTFASAFVDGDELYYVVEDKDTGDWELGLGTFDSATPSISRAASPIDSSNSGAAVSFAAGDKRVFATLPSTAVVSPDGTPSEGQVLTYDAATETWKPVTFSTYSPVVEETTTSRTLMLTDGNKYILGTNVDGCAVTVPEQATISWGADIEIHGRSTQDSTTFVAGTGVTINVPTGFSLEARPGAAWTLKREAADVWSLIGNLTGDVVEGASLSTANTWLAGQRGEVTALTSTTNSVAINLADSNNFSLTMTENTTLAAPTNAVEGQTGIIYITQDATTARTLAYNTFWKFEGGTVPALSTTLGSINAFPYTVNAGGASATCSLIRDIS